MDIQEIKNIWQAYDQKLEQSLAINLYCLEAIQTQKAKSKLNSLLLLKILASIAGLAWAVIMLFVVWVTFMVSYHQSWTASKVALMISAGMVAVITLIGVAVYIRHIVWIWQINASENVVDMQKKTAALQLSTIQVSRILFLQLPFYVTWNFQSAWVSRENLLFWMVYLPMVLLFTGLAVWLYKNLSYQNADKRWFKFLFDNPEWTSPAKAMKFLQEIEDFKKSEA